MKVDKVGVVGLGTMGSNIAIVCARGGKETVVFEADAQAMEAGMGRVRAFLDSGVEKGKTSSEERDAMLGRIHEAESLTGFEDCDLVIEAITEDREEKNKLLRSLNAVLGGKRHHRVQHQHALHLPHGGGFGAAHEDHRHPFLPAGRTQQARGSRPRPAHER